MTEKEKQDRFLLYIPKGKEKEFELYKKVVRKLGLTVNERVFSMIQSDMETVMIVIESIMKKEKKKENEQ
ncbi:hypothetical protein MUP77_00305 [Candidatus Bathyarchaeota archaeon]|nr:hypothetical protein [Candidatus Bathyarchaeota archaeon]